MTEPTDVELNEIESNEEDMALDFTDSLIYLENGLVLVTRIVKNMEPGAEGTIVLYKPFQLVSQFDATIMMGDWMPESDDDYIFLPMDRVLTIASPKKEVLDYYHTTIGVTENAYLPEGETLH